MKKIVLIITALMSVSAFAQDAQKIRDQELIRELEASAEFKAMEKEAVPSEAKAKRKFKKTRLLKVKLAKKGIAQKIAKEMDLKLVSGKKRKVATFKVRKGQDIDAMIASLKAHKNVVKVKREVLVNKNSPK